MSEFKRIVKKTIDGKKRKPKRFCTTIDENVLKEMHLAAKSMNINCTSTFIEYLFHHWKTVNHKF